MDSSSLCFPSLPIPAKLKVVFFVFVTLAAWPLIRVQRALLSAANRIDKRRTLKNNPAVVIKLHRNIVDGERANQATGSRISRRKV